ncbi:MAG: hypothetical protein ACI395_05425 [Candidatus Cryptobacteroides sp.]
MKYMKLSFLSIAAAAAFLVFASCTKEGTARFDGNFTFKTGGTITVTEKDNTAGGAEPETISLTAEGGQMDILTVDKKTGKMIVTMNITGGTVLTFDALAQEKTLTLEPIERTVKISVGNDLTKVDAKVTVSGFGERFTDVIIFRLTYEGGYTFLGTEYVIQSSSVDCVAKKN